MIATRYKASVHLTLHVHVDGDAFTTAEQVANDMIRDLASLRQGVFASDVSGVIRPVEITEAMRDTNMVIWQETEALKLGTDDQRLRHAAGSLPESELILLAQSQLFAAFSAFKTTGRLTAAGIGHPRMPSGAYVCTSDPGEPEIPVTWSTMPMPALTPPEWATLARMNRAVNETNRHPWLVDATAGATIVTRIHKGVCQRCQRSAAQVAALVTIAWAGRILSREYAL